MLVLDRAELSQDQHVRWKPSRIQVPGKEMWRDRTVGGEMKRVTVVGVVLMAALTLIAIIVIKALTKRNDSDQKESRP